jgi:hypothetical protein
LIEHSANAALSIHLRHSCTNSASHTHTFPGDTLSGRSDVERKWGTHFVNCAQLSKYHSFVTCPPMSRHFTFTSGSRLVRVRCYLHDDSYAPEGWYAPAERVVELGKPFNMG